MTIKLLTIEDDAELAQAVARCLHTGFTIDIAPDGQEGLRKFTYDDYQLVLLDLTLPDMPGIVVCEGIRRIRKETPILVLTGTADTDTQINLLDAGADDYVTKPFDGRQLRARIDALLRRTGLASAAVLKIHDMIIDTRKRQATRAGRTIALRRKEYDILEYLARNKGQAVTRAMISDAIWNGEMPNSIDVHIKHLRDKIDHPFSVPLIETVHGVGYMVEDLPPNKATAFISK